MGKLIHNGITYTQVNRGLDSAVRSLKDCYLIGYSDTAAHQSPIDANNYIEVVGDDVILHRSSNSNNCSIYTELNAGDRCTVFFDDLANTDGNIYIHKCSDISTEPVVMQRISTQQISSNMTSFVAPENAYYVFSFWSNNTNSITLSNPQCFVF